jgi:osmoprotectant transport system ATP-binding protein
VIQEAGLLPHFTVAANVALVPRLLGWPVARREARARELLALVGLDADRYASSFPAQLSGGQRQRVGLARALAADPPLLLMDEPFGALDPLTRRRLQDEFKELQRRLRTTVVLVTHDVPEALRLADEIAVMDEGRVLQRGTPEAIRNEPQPGFVAEFVRAALP